MVARSDPWALIRPDDPEICLAGPALVVQAADV
jgi:hypothetical protein